MKQTSQLFQLQFLHPKYWILWICYGGLLLITLCPHWLQIKFGSCLGWIGYHLLSHRRHIVEINLRLCFPSLSNLEQRLLVSRTFRSSGIGLIETASAWIHGPKKFQHRTNFTGLEHLETALSQGKGVLLVGMHFSTLDLCGALLSSHIGFDVMYRRNKNKLLELIMTRGRERNHPAAIERDDIRQVLKSLKRGHAVWYGPDQDYGARQSIFVPFFGVNTATITATARLARISGSAVILFSHYRTKDDARYIIELSKPLENFPSGVDADDASLINQYIEQAINKAPDQYWWVHRRFKTRPLNEPRPY
ncbi:MAG: LpxL/LpxP family Kdo(2)-lipid IV(A) lauroyl/palmitoleoyl acyltransferase [Pseudomonadales bacterium]|nr:LpxL/LpxP family Kdo(2)-lipid IV(A) lauroyl/palmitoleoyl acyltransferase [Pseudomonadales bacterium]